ncbi:hypothetical protein [Saccharomonospora piscinae]|uniref:hypothetical protein n=1 Tax=Saccharomonospora piscinae TaxID=687388 RepID=UPI00207BC4BB|nr:hypothetical protein [Saccharomonospora piscinae]
MTNTAPLPAVGGGPGHRPAGGFPPSQAGGPPAPGPPEPAPGGGGPTPVMLGALLVGVAVVVGLVWGLLRSGGDGGVQGTPEAAEPPASPLTSGPYTYEVVGGPEEATDCSANSYGDMIDWFAGNPCERVLRGLYTVQEGQARALVSVVTVTMPAGGAAQQLKAVTDTDGTGNVHDLARDGTVQLPGAPVVANGEYHSVVDGRDVTIVEAAFFAEHSDPALLEKISTDAVRLTEHLRAG